MSSTRIAQDQLNTASATASNDDRSKTETLSHYINPDEITRGDKIGKGHFAAVYQGTLKQSNKTVAIKQFRDMPNSTADYFQLEENILSELNKLPLNHVVKYYGHSSLQTTEAAPPARCLVIEYMPGGEFFDWLVRHKNHLWHVEYKFLAQTAYACVELHKHNYLHCDLKPENILLTADENIKVADLGLAIYLGDASYASAQGKGSPSYMAPEITLQNKFSRKSDIFAVGAIMYATAMRSTFMLDKKRSGNEVIQAVAKGERSPISPKCPAELASLINACVAQDPEKRPTAEIVYEKLTRLQRTAENAFAVSRSLKVSYLAASMQAVLMKQKTEVVIQVVEDDAAENTAARTPAR
jgi:protein kinase D